MFPGPTLIKQCAGCAQPFAQETLASGNTFGAKYWTDGKTEAPMLPDQPALIKCPHCQALLWIEAQNLLDEVDFGDRTAYPAAQAYLLPTFEDYWEVLASGDCDLEQERYLRFQIWWTGNDQRRNRTTPLPLSEPEIENLWALMALLYEVDEPDRLMKAEMLRELGEFTEALTLLSEPFAPDFLESACIMRDLARAGDPQVGEITTRRYIRGTERLADALILEVREAYPNAADWAAEKEANLPQPIQEKRTEVKQRKYQYLKSMQPDERQAMAHRHPVWILHYDLRWTDLTAAVPWGKDERGHRLIVCRLAPTIHEHLFGYYLCGGVVLSIHQQRPSELMHSEDPSIWERQQVQRKLMEKEWRSVGELFKRGSQAEGFQWTFIGHRWNFTENEQLLLDFGNHETEVTYFCQAVNSHCVPG